MLPLLEGILEKGLWYVLFSAATSLIASFMELTRDTSSSEEVQQSGHV